MKARSQRSHTRPANEEFLRFTSSVHFDSALWKYDIAGTIAHARALEKAGVLTRGELESIERALKDIAWKISGGDIAFDPELEDIHMNIERLLTDRIGDAGAKIHTGRSRNDQVALDMRLLVRERLLRVMEKLLAMQKTILARAQQVDDVILPGYTHLQHAQPVLLSHHLLAHFWRMNRDQARLAECFQRTNISPLGAGALAGTAFPIDRELTAKMLGMTAITENSLDAVSDRDFAAETAFALSLIMIHLSSLSEEFILWSSQEFGFLKLPREMSSGSSMMPQKRNPDLPELVRGKSGRAIGDLIAILTLMKSLPLAYNRDLQEDKEALFDALDTAEGSLTALTDFLKIADFDKVRMRMSAEVGMMTATDLADFLTTRGVPFRKAHSIVREMADSAAGDDSRFLELARAAIAEYSGEAIEDTTNLLSMEQSIERKGAAGGTARDAVKRQRSQAKMAVERTESLTARMRKQTGFVDRLLEL